MSTTRVRQMAGIMRRDSTRQHTLPTVALVLQQPRDYRKLAAVAETLSVTEKVYIVDDYLLDGYFAAACLEMLQDHGVAYQLASEVLEANCQFAVGIYEANLWRKYTSYSHEFLLVWLWRRRQEGRLSWQTARNMFTELGSITETMSRIVNRIGARLQYLSDSPRWRHYTFSQVINAFGASTDGVSSGQGVQLGATESEQVNPHATASVFKHFSEAGKAFAQQVCIPVPLAKDLSRISVLAPSYTDDVTTSFPEAHIRHFFDLYLTATDRHRQAVERVVGKRAETIGYPQYWAAQAIDRPREELRRHLRLGEDSRIIAWLPVGLDRLTVQIDYLQALTESFTVVLRPHPDLYLPENEGVRRAIEGHAHARNVSIQDSRSMEAGLLVRGADLVIAEGVSSLLSSLFLGAHVAVGLNPLRSKYRRWDKKAGAGLTDLTSIDRAVLPSSDLAKLLTIPAWRRHVKMRSDGIRRHFFGEIPSAEIGRQRCAAALRRLSVNANI